MLMTLTPPTPQWQHRSASVQAFDSVDCSLHQAQTDDIIRQRIITSNDINNRDHKISLPHCQHYCPDCGS